jgi:hypothetical protein
MRDSPERQASAQIKMAFRDLESKAAALRFGTRQDTFDYIAYRFGSLITLK